MDILSIAGVFVGVGAILLGIMLDGGDIHSLVNVPALIIVFGGHSGRRFCNTHRPFLSEA